MGAADDLSECEDIAVEAWAVGLPVLHDRVFAFPLNTEAGTVAIVAGVLSDRVDPARLGRRGPDPQADAAARRRAPSTSTPRCCSRRSATRPPPRSGAGWPARCTTASRRTSPRSATSSTPCGVGRHLARAGRAARDAARADLRRSSPRSAARWSPCAPASARARASAPRSARSPATCPRCPASRSTSPSTSTPSGCAPRSRRELFRIAQEAMNNAVRHAQASAIDVHCQVHAPAGADHRHRQRPRPPGGPVRPRTGCTSCRSGRCSSTPRSRSARPPTGGLSVSVRLPGEPRVRSAAHPDRSMPRSERKDSPHEPTTPITVLLVDDHELIRSGLAGVFDLEEDMTIVAQAGSVVEALRKYDELQPDVVVADLQLQDGTGLDIVRSIRKVSNTTGLVVLTMHSGDDQIFAAMQAGASGFVGKDAPSARGRARRPARGRLAALVRLHRPGRRDDAPQRRGVHPALRPRARGAAAPRRRPGRRRDRREALPQRVDRQVPHRPHLPEAGRHQPRPGPGHRDADRAALQRPPRRQPDAHASPAGARCVAPATRPDRWTWPVSSRRRRKPLVRAWCHIRSRIRSGAARHSPNGLCRPSLGLDLARFRPQSGNGLQQYCIS